jgi:hypothetical protein
MAGVEIDGESPSKTVQQAFCTGVEKNSRHDDVPPYDSGHSFGIVSSIVSQ